MRTQEQEFFNSIRLSLGLDPQVTRNLSAFYQSLESDFSAIPVSSEGQQDLLELLSRHCPLHNLSLHVADNKAHAVDLLVEIAHSTDLEFHDDRQLVAHQHPLLEQLQLSERFQTENLHLHICTDNDPDRLKKHQISCIGITAPEIVIAAPAAVIQQTGPGMPRVTSLLPSRHIAVAGQEHLVASLEEAYIRLKGLTDQNPVIISGPSKTADIEASLVYGAHGPREMDLIIIQNDQ